MCVISIEIISYHGKILLYRCVYYCRCHKFCMLREIPWDVYYGVLADSLCGPCTDCLSSLDTCEVLIPGTRLIRQSNHSHPPSLGPRVLQRLTRWQPIFSPLCLSRDAVLTSFRLPCHWGVCRCLTEGIGLCWCPGGCVSLFSSVDIEWEVTMGDENDICTCKITFDKSWMSKWRDLLRPHPRTT